jgi:hypothetical protein
MPSTDENPFTAERGRRSPGSAAARGPIVVPGASGASAFRMWTGIPLSITGPIVWGCRTAAPK